MKSTLFLAAWAATGALAVDPARIAADLKALERDAASLGITAGSEEDALSRSSALGVSSTVSVGDSACTSAGGQCLDGYPQVGCNGSWLSGKCSGSSSRKCCVASSSSNGGGDTACRALGGTCIQGFPNAACNGRWESNKCSGGASNKCCVSNAAPDSVTIDAEDNNNNNNNNNNSENNDNNTEQNNNTEENNNNSEGSGSSDAVLYVPGTKGGTSTWPGLANPGSTKCGQHLSGNCVSKGTSCEGEFRAGFCPGSSICCAPLEKNLMNNNHGNHPVVARVGSKSVMRTASKGASVFFKGNMDADADGAPNAYCPDNRSLDSITHGGMSKPGHCPGRNSCYGMAFHPNSRRLCIQGPKDPYPGCYVSVTAVAKSWRPNSSNICNPHNYANSLTNPYFVIPRDTGSGMSKLDLGIIYDRGSNRALFSWVADIGPSDHTGEASIASLLAFDYAPFKNGKVFCGTAKKDSDRFTYIVFSGTRADSGFIDNFEEVKRRGEIAFNNWGGMARLEKLVGRTGIKFIGRIRTFESVPNEYKQNGCRFMN